MKIAKEDIEIKLEIPGVVIRQKKGFGDTTGYGKISTEFFSLSAGVDTTPIFIGLEGDLCQCQHWEYVLSGQITTTESDGIKETVNNNELFFWSAGHNVKMKMWNS